MNARTATDRIAAERLLDGHVAVSRETWGRLEVFVALLERWQSAQNLVGARTLETVWTRHVADSLQAVPLLGGACVIADLGSGAGFPGLVVAIACAERTASDRPQVHLIESNKRKAAFLQTVARETGVNVVVHACRAEGALSELAENPTGVDLVTARALAPFDELLELAEPALSRGAAALFHKGRGSELELAQASRYWNFEVTRMRSLVSSDSVILRLAKVARLTETVVNDAPG